MPFCPTEMVQGAGDSQTGGGLGGYHFRDTTNSNATDFNESETGRDRQTTRLLPVCRGALGLGQAMSSG